MRKFFCFFLGCWILASTFTFPAHAEEDSYKFPKYYWHYYLHPNPINQLSSIPDFNKFSRGIGLAEIAFKNFLILQNRFGCSSIELIRIRPTFGELPYNMEGVRLEMESVCKNDPSRYMTPNYEEGYRGIMLAGAILEKGSVFVARESFDKGYVPSPVYGSIVTESLGLEEDASKSIEINNLPTTTWLKDIGK